METKLMYRVEEVAKLLDVGRTAVFDLIRNGELASVKIGGARRIPRQAVDNYIEHLMEGAL
ncbi:helix-turn-helix domain-containing protein [Allosaccharopolyspora coralli]|uniref:Helix-turn-helix domain-containing protein n=1 Tax=Allosaccharopolyspora coralli TaxID=2665642 RepID=A0A5Q3Q1Q8_9PSEU|nr:helix-turn-helix domain-containing protein [Allosaccharopolyspora coralli]QGK68471.1 helix-turn-helix domain-containing protein [Allosaccharopolyspora coralli]